MAESLAYAFIIVWNLFWFWIYKRLRRIERNTMDAYGRVGYPIKPSVPMRLYVAWQVIKGFREYEKEVAIIAEAKRNAREKEGLDV